MTNTSTQRDQNAAPAQSTPQGKIEQWQQRLAGFETESIEAYAALFDFRELDPRHPDSVRGHVTSQIAELLKECHLSGGSFEQLKAIRALRSSLEGKVAQFERYIQNVPADLADVIAFQATSQVREILKSNNLFQKFEAWQTGADPRLLTQLISHLENNRRDFEGLLNQAGDKLGLSDKVLEGKEKAWQDTSPDFLKVFGFADQSLLGALDADVINEISRAINRSIEEKKLEMTGGRLSELQKKGLESALTEQERALLAVVKPLDDLWEFYAKVADSLHCAAQFIERIKGFGGVQEEIKAEKELGARFNYDRQLTQQWGYAGDAAMLLREESFIKAWSWTGAVLSVPGVLYLANALQTSQTWTALIQKGAELGSHTPLYGGLAAALIAGSGVLMYGGAKLLTRVQMKVHDWLFMGKTSIGDSILIKVLFRKMMGEIAERLDPEFERRLPHQFNERGSLQAQTGSIFNLLDDAYAKDKVAAAVAKRAGLLFEGKSAQDAQVLRTDLIAKLGQNGERQKALNTQAALRWRALQETEKDFERKLRELPPLHATNMAIQNFGARTDLSVKIRSFGKGYRRACLVQQQENNYPPDQLDGFHRTIIMELQDVDIRESRADVARTKRQQPLADEIYQVQNGRLRWTYTIGMVSGIGGAVGTVAHAMWPFIQRALDYML